MRNVCKVLSWLSSSTAAALLGLAVLAAPSTARSNESEANAPIGCFLCTDACPDKMVSGCRQNSSYCTGSVCPACNCDPVVDTPHCACNNER